MSTEILKRWPASADDAAGPPTKRRNIDENANDSLGDRANGTAAEMSKQFDETLNHPMQSVEPLAGPSAVPAAESALPPRLIAQPHSQYGWDLSTRTVFGSQVTGLRGDGIPIRKWLAAGQRLSPLTDLAQAKDFDEFRVMLNGEEEEGDDGAGSAEGRTMERYLRPREMFGPGIQPGEGYSKPDLLIGTAIGCGRLWHVQEGELRLPIREGTDDAETAMMEDPTAEELENVAKGMRDMSNLFAGLGKTKTEPTRVKVATPPEPTYVERTVAVKFACPTALARESQHSWPRYKTPSPGPYDDPDAPVYIDPYEVFNDDWRFSAEEIEQRILNEARIYSSNLQSIAGQYVPKYYGLWSFELEEGRVYMMVLERLQHAASEGINLTQRFNSDNTQVSICKAYTAIHNANVVTRDIDERDIMTRFSPVTGLSIVTSIYRLNSQKAPRSKTPLMLKVVDFDRALDLSSMSPEDRRAAVQLEREAVMNKWRIETKTWKAVDEGKMDLGEEDSDDDYAHEEGEWYM